MSQHPRSEAPSVHSSIADVWYLKQIQFRSRPVKIITQNFNGPCSFIAICNILILRSQIEILPHDRTTVSYEFLSQLVGEYLLTNCPDIDISAALSIMPSTTKGLDLNPQFTSVTAFSPSDDAGELELFAKAGIQLLHGWVVDPESPEAAVMTHIRDYDSAVNLIADADYLTQGQLLGGADAPPHPDGSPTVSDDDRVKIEQAIVAQRYLDATRSQLTYHGLFQLASTLQPGALVALFRNAHLSVVYKSPGRPDPHPHSPGPDPDASAGAGAGSSSSSSAEPESTTTPANDGDDTSAHASALYALVTDDAFLHEPSIVWERLEDVDGHATTFCDSDFHRAVPVGGDVAGQAAVLRQLEEGDPADHALAQQLQAEEDQRAVLYRQQLQQQQRRRAEAEAQAQASTYNSNNATSSAAVERRQKKPKKKKKECVIM